MPVDYDVIVVGAGIIGSAAARHLVEISTNLRVLLIGPEEPQDRNTSEIFASHYDEGRLTMAMGPSTSWSTLAKRSVDNYRRLEEQSGVRLYEEVGYLMLGYKNQPSHYDTETAQKYRVELHTLDHSQMAETFPYLKTSEEHVGTYTPKQSGYINPRTMVRVQKLLAKQKGCDVMDDIVKRIAPIGLYKFDVEAERSGRVFRCEKVLIATGCFTHCRNLLPRGLQLDIDLRGTTTLLAEVDESELYRLRNMPSMVEDGYPGTEYVLNSYLLPPIKYPDGKYYLKIGPGREHSVPLHTARDLAHWYQHGHDNIQHRFLLDKLHELFPDILFRSYKFDYCVCTGTENEHVMVDLIAPGIGVVVGGNGFAAKSGDEIGHVAARMMLKGAWDYDLPADPFKAKFKRKTSKL